MQQAIGVRKHLIFDFESGLRLSAAKKMGLDTFEEPVADVENVAEVMKDEIADIKARIKELQDEIDILTVAVSECNHIILEAGSDLLEPAEPVEVEPLPQLVPGEGARVASVSSFTDVCGKRVELYQNNPTNKRQFHETLLTGRRRGNSEEIISSINFGRGDGIPISRITCLSKMII